MNTPLMIWLGIVISVLLFSGYYSYKNRSKRIDLVYDPIWEGYISKNTSLPVFCKSILDIGIPTLPKYKNPPSRLTLIVSVSQFPGSVKAEKISHSFVTVNNVSHVVTIYVSGLFRKFKTNTLYFVVLPVK